MSVASSVPERVTCPTVGHFGITEMSWAGRIQNTQQCNSEHQDNVNDDSSDDDGSRQINSRSSSRSPSSSIVSIGCSGSSALQIRMKSHCEPPSEFFADYHCHGWWSENGITYLLTTRSSSQQSLRPQRHCFAFRDLSGPSTSTSQQQQQHSTSLTREDSNGQADSLGYNNNHNNRGGGIIGEDGSLLVFSSFADSCRRNVVLGQEGDFAFNVTKIGQCSAMSFAPGLHHQVNYSFILILGSLQLSLLFILLRQINLHSINL